MDGIRRYTFNPFVCLRVKQILKIVTHPDRHGRLVGTINNLSGLTYQRVQFDHI